MTILERLNALDAKVLPPSHSVNRLERSWLLYVVFLALAVSIAWGQELPGERAAGLVILSYAMYAFGRDVERLRRTREEHGDALGLPRVRRYLRAGLVVAVVALTASDYVADRHSPRIDLVAARAVAQTVIDVAVAGDAVEICRLARDPDDCARAVRATSRRPGRVSIESVERGPGFTDFASVSLRSVSDHDLCWISVVNVKGRVVVENPVYWADGC